MMRVLLWIGSVMLLWACTTNDMSLTPVTIIICEDIELATTSNTLACFRIGDSWIVQSPPDEEVALQWANAQITIQGTLIITQNGDVYDLGTLSGTVVLGINQRAQIIPEGALTSIILIDDQFTRGTESLEPLYIENDASQILGQLPFAIMPPRPIEPPIGFTPDFLVTETGEAVLNATRTPNIPPDANCAVREDWFGTHIVVSGETLSRISQSYGLSLDSIQDGNCLVNINRLQVGQELIVPLRPTQTPENAPTATPSAVLFRTDRNTIVSGECTMLRWDVFNVESVTLDGEDVLSNSSQEVCPTITTIYQLQVTFFDEQIRDYTVTLTVNE